MDTIDFKKLSEQLRSELLRVNGWRKVVRTGSIAVYLFVFCWFMFVLFGGALVSYIGLENYMQITQYIIPVFIGFIVVNFVFTRCMANFQERESEAMQHIMSTLFPTVYFSASSQVDSRILRDSKLFSASFSEIPSLSIRYFILNSLSAKRYTDVTSLLSLYIILAHLPIIMASLFSVMALTSFNDLSIGFVFPNPIAIPYKRLFVFI